MTILPIGRTAGVLTVIANCKTTQQTNRQIELDRQNKTVDN